MGYHDILGLYVPMRYALLVQAVHCLTDHASLGGHLLFSQLALAFSL